LGVALLLSPLARAATELTEVERDLLAKVLALQRPEKGFNVVHAETGGRHTLVEDEPAARAKFIKFAAKNLEIDGCDSAALVAQLLERNGSPGLLGFESDEKQGWIVDTEGTFMKYFAEDGGGWEKWKKENPDARAFLTVSIPVLDEKTGTVLVYVGTQTGDSSGSGFIYAYRQRGWAPPPPPIPADIDAETRERLLREQEKVREKEKKSNRYFGEPADLKLIEAARALVWLS